LTTLSTGEVPSKRSAIAMRRRSPLSTLLPPNSFLAESRSQWRSWLEENEQRRDGIWLITFKKHSGQTHLSYNEAVEEALCFGWIDSKPNKLDEQRTMLWFAPRKSGTGWSRANKERVHKMIDAGAMTAAGLAKIEAAKEDGSWDALDGVEALEIPPDLAAALAAYEFAGTNFEAFPRSTKRAILEWILKAKTPETRAKRIANTAQLANENIRANQWRR
jgi:uncharacterized protein YdeI (YjbR/CyaY-like superfamily)